MHLNQNQLLVDPVWNFFPGALGWGIAGFDWGAFDRGSLDSGGAGIAGSVVMVGAVAARGCRFDSYRERIAAAAAFESNSQRDRTSSSGCMPQTLSGMQ